MGVLALTINACASDSTYFQVSTGNALIAGLYQGAVNFKTLRQHGDFGLGSVEGMDGELIAIDGQFYRIDPQGKMNVIPNEQKTGYAIVTHFKPVSHFHVHGIKNFSQLVSTLNQHLPSRNIPYAIMIKGHYDSLRLRAVRGAKPPYPPFSKLVKKQAIFNFKNKNGNGVGFFTPPFLSKVNVPGYHIHFITSDRKTGGHILNCKISDADIYLMPMHHLTIAFPRTAAFSNANLNINNDKLMVSQFGVGIQMK
jgi:acetolactate decarboxylase